MFYLLVPLYLNFNSKVTKTKNKVTMAQEGKPINSRCGQSALSQVLIKHFLYFLSESCVVLYFIA